VRAATKAKAKAKAKEGQRIVAYNRIVGQRLQTADTRIAKVIRTLRMRQNPCRNSTGVTFFFSHKSSSQMGMTSFLSLKRLVSSSIDHGYSLNCTTSLLRTWDSRARKFENLRMLPHSDPVFSTPENMKMTLENITI
jgi:hypothetical protein